MAPLARVVLSERYRGQFALEVEEGFRWDAANAVRVGDLAEDGTVLNQDRVFEVCRQLSEAGFDVRLSRDAAERAREVMDETPPDIPSLALPEGFVPKRFQLRCINSLRGERRAMIQSSTGTGKSFMGLAIAAARLDAGEVDRVVVWCPSALVGDWVRNFGNLSRLRAATVPKSAPPAKRAEWYLMDQGPVWVLNYERLRTADAEPIAKALKGRRVMFLMDEVTKLKNRSSKLHSSMKRLMKSVKCGDVLALTATPMVVGPEDFYNEWRIIDPERFGLVRDFERDFTYDEGARDFWGNYVGYVNLDAMRSRVGAQMFSADKSSPEIAAEFPRKDEIAVELELSRQDRSVYDELWEVGDRTDPEVRSGALFASVLRRVCEMPECLLNVRVPGPDADPDYADQVRRVVEVVERCRSKVEGSKNSAKLEYVQELVGELISQGERVVVFGDKTHNLLFPLARHLEAFSPQLYVGGMGQGERDEVVDAFKRGDRRLLLMSDAGQMGLNLQECRYLIHYQTPYTGAAYIQRSERINRLSSEYDAVTVYRFTTRDTVEERIEALLQERMRLSREMGIASEYEELGSDGAMRDVDYICGFTSR